jgi:hypothetical protein
MTRAKDISKIVTDADLSGTLDVTGTVTADDIAISDSTPTFTMTDTDTNALFRVSASSAVGSVTLEVDENGVGSNPQFLIQGQNVDRFRIDGDNGDISFYEDTGTTPKLFWDASAESLGIGTSSPAKLLSLQSSTQYNGIKLSNGTNTVGEFLGFAAGNDAGGLKLYTGGTATAEVQASGYTFFNGGNVGIGTSSPASDGKLTIHGTDTDSGILLSRSSGNDVAIHNIGGTLAFRTGGESTTLGGLTERMRIDSSGNVGIGVTSLTQKFEVSGKGVFSTANPDVNGLQIKATTGTNASAMQFTNAVNGYVGLDNSTGGRFGSGNYGLVMYQGSAYPITFHTNATERMRINSSGNVMIGTTSDNGRRFTVVHPNNSYIQTLNNSHGSSPFGMSIVYSSASPDNNDNQFLACTDSTTNRLLIWADGDVDNHDNSYSGFSDLKLKEQIVDASSQWDDIKALTVRKFKFKTDVANGDSDSHWRLGVIAQELETAGMNGLVRESIDRDSDNNDLGTTTKSVKYSILYMKAVKALQEAITRIETLETAKTDLEARIVALETAN